MATDDSGGYDVSQFEPSDVARLDFEAAYRGGELLDGYRYHGIPWDIGEPQPLVVEFERAGRFRGEVLDAGCGVGGNSLFLAAAGHRVTGIDGAPTAVERCRALATERGLAVDFQIADATVLDGLDDRFDSVLDSALYHCLDADEQRRYAAALHRVTRPGALLSLLCFADEGDNRMPVPMTQSADALRATLTAAGWTVTGLDLGHYASLPDPTLLGMGMTASDDGRLWMSVWVAEAERA